MPLIVRQHENMFYVTNLSSESITAKLDFDKPGSVSRVTNRAEIQIPERTLSLVIEPYSLLVFRSENRARVVGAEVVPGRVAR
jgi:hypothetical protein